MSIFTRFDRHAGLMGRMAATLGIDLSEEAMAGRLTPGDYRGAVFSCTACTRPDDCAEWTAAHVDGATRAPDYCRNKERFERLRRL